MAENPDSYIRVALEGQGVKVRTLTIHSYSPEAFGNLEADAETNVGSLRIIYDRGFFLESDGEWSGPSFSQLADALEMQKRRDGR